MRPIELSALSALCRFSRAAILIAALAIADGCSPASQVADQGRAPDTPDPTAVGAIAARGSPTPSPETASPSVVTPSRAIASSSPYPTAPMPSPGPTSVYGCPAGPCPASLEYAVNGCSCAGEIYDDSRVSAQFCCRDGFSDSECPEALQLEALAESIFGETADDVEAHLVTVMLQGWPATVHEKAAPAFRQVAAEIENMTYRIEEPVESYSRKEIEGHEVLSMHTFGIAVDINPSRNPRCGVSQSCQCNNELITDMPADFVQAFKDAGFDWGGDWVEHPDPMHFEWAEWLRSSLAGP